MAEQTTHGLAERKAKITGRIHRIEGIQHVNNGFKQNIMLHISELKDEMTGRVVRKEQYYTIQLWSNAQTDSRFRDSKHIKELVSCSVYLNSYHWQDPKEGLKTIAQLNFIEWLKV